LSFWGPIQTCGSSRTTNFWARSTT
jgi:hypothetical protein